MNKLFLVIGGSGHVGQALVLSLLNEGYEVVATFHTNQSVLKNAQLSQAKWIACDVRTNDGRKGLREYLDKLERPLDGVAITVGKTPPSLKKDNAERLNFYRSFEGTEDQTATWMDEAFNVHGKGTYLALKETIPYLQNAVNPNIVITGSLIGHKAVNTPVAFAATKSCTRGLVESLSKDLGEFNIKVNSVDPGMLESGASALISDQLKREYLKHCSLRRFGKAEEVANVITYFLDENTYVTGQSVLLDGAL
ncbi:MAG: SDR family oxidoreductase [Bdellovibrio sp.]|nr:SDR family oxidoreductase [Bdellovibrio sp.]